MISKSLAHLLPSLLVLFGLVACGANGSAPAVDAEATPASSLLVERFPVNLGSAEQPFRENVYLVRDTASGDAVIIDPGMRSEKLEAVVARDGLTVHAVLNTHGHGDHIGGNGAYRERYGAEVIAHEGDEPRYRERGPANAPTRWLDAPTTLKFGTLEIAVLPTPGHSAGGVCYHIGAHLLSGDTLFRRSIGRTGDDEHAPAATHKVTLIESIRRELMTLPDATIVYPGHGATSTIGEERVENRFLIEK